ncbi:MupA/Atu3671 family FMN-dependent luciferase-like monooxygenase [uncultured Kordia sp.]|uniref:MupA/Atu3671 family FMN-dependent luciferase-like monooxygenase n=1 Tax=uncultured Kordia sp. TaxID=507699 RepID=UPI00260B0352|nr:MupA/Atu3671 family FMN-dependent luciferase-like monooxygenase [uncultured Kordia sp.]
MKLFIKLNDLGVQLNVENGELKIKAPKGVLTAPIITEIKAHKSDLITLLSSSDMMIPKAEEQKSYPLTSAQNRMWILHQLQGSSAAYTIPRSFEILGPLELSLLEEAFQQMMVRHESLRTYFEAETDREIRQYIVPVDFINFSLEVIQTDEVGAKQIISDVYNHSFSLPETPLWKVNVFQLTEECHVVSLIMHHIISDGWSIEIFIKEVFQIYTSLKNGQAINLPELMIQYKDYAVWNEKQRLDASYKEAAEYWMTTFSGELPKLEMPSFVTRPSIKTYNGGTIKHDFSPELTVALEEFAKKEEISFFMLLLASVNILCYKYTNATDIILGTPMVNRDNSLLEAQIGLYLNTLALRTKFEEDQTVQELLAIQKNKLLEAHTHKAYPFDELVDELMLARDISRSPLFDVMVTLHNQEELRAQSSQQIEDITVNSFQISDKKTSQLDYTFDFFNVGNLQLQLTYNSDIYEASQGQRIMLHLENILGEMLADPSQKIKDISYLSESETSKLLYEFNDTAFSYDTNQTIINLFEDAVTKTPEKIALVSGDTELTYAELHKKSNQLANHINTLSKNKAQVIALCVDRSVEMIIGILGILKSGNQYLPIDSSHPEERIQYILKDSHTQLILTKKDITTFIDFNKECTLVFLDASETWNSNSDENPTTITTKNAYVIYTSGTTGKPKGVAISHQNLVNFFIALNNEFGEALPEDTWLAVTNISFDISILELLWTLTRSNTVVIQPDRPMVTETIEEMDFSLFYFAAQEAESNQNKYNLLLQGAEIADAYNFAGIWVPERHFHTFGDPYPNPSIAAAAVAVKTEKVTIRSGSVVLPLHDPIRVAEEWSMVDNLSNGRVELSIASGWNPNDFVLAPNNYEDRHKIMRDHIQTLTKLWKGESIKRTNGLGKEIDIQLHPKPVQDALEIWITAAGSIETFEYAGEIGANILTHLLGQNIEELEEKITAYRKALETHGYDPTTKKIALMLHTFVSHDDEYVRNTVEEPFKNYLRHSVNLIKPLAEAANLDIENDMDTIINMAFDRYYHSSGLFGTPTSCIHKIKKIKAIGVDEIACLIDYGIEESIVLENLKYVSELNESIQKQQRKSNYFAKRLETKWSIPEIIQKHGVNQLQTTPSLMQEILLSEGGKAALQQLKTLLVGGEALPKELVNTLLELRQKPLYNMYGPTETTIWSSYKKIDTVDAVTIGKPLANTCIYILNETQQLCSIGVVGELCIGGDGVALGYLGREDLNAKKFINNPFPTNEQYPTLYKTGDLARWLPNGELECLGRIDDQVKINGHRIETAEIENILNQFSGITQAVVVYNKKIQDLVVYLLANSIYDESTLRNYMSAKLPNYMLPNHYYEVTEFPLNQNGKIRRNVLAEREITTYITTKYEAPRNDLDAQIVAIWEEILSLSQIGITQEFFELGGNSLKGMFLINKINEQFGIELNLLDMFSHTQIKSLSDLVQQQLDSIQKTYTNEIII